MWGHTSANGGARWTHNALEAHQASQGAAAMREAGRGGARQAGVPRSTKIPAKKRQYHCRSVILLDTQRNRSTPLHAILSNCE